MSDLIYRENEGKTFTFREDGYFNMTKAAKAFGKEAKHFWALSSIVEYLEALSEIVGKTDLYQTIRGRNGGTWGHPKLAVFFARWVDPKFAVFCDSVIDDILSKNRADHHQARAVDDYAGATDFPRGAASGYMSEWRKPLSLPAQLFAFSFSLAHSPRQEHKPKDHTKTKGSSLILHDATKQLSEDLAPEEAREPEEA